jgi:hypothetical protein
MGALQSGECPFIGANMQNLLEDLSVVIHGAKTTASSGKQVSSAHDAIPAQDEDGGGGREPQPTF